MNYIVLGMLVAVTISSALTIWKTHTKCVALLAKEDFGSLPESAEAKEFFAKVDKKRTWRSLLAVVLIYGATIAGVVLLPTLPILHQIGVTIVAYVVTSVLSYTVALAIIKQAQKELSGGEG